jgi:energy-coupling factor transport system ATP-binding protein
MGIIKAAKLAFDYLRYDEDGNVEATQRAVDGVDLDIQAGEFVAVLGHNGSGKSTFAKHINALLLPTEGTIWIDGIDTSKESELWKVRQKAGMVFQNPDNQIIGTVVEEDVGFGPENMGIPTDDIWKRVDDSLEKVGMTAYRYQSPNKLSGGQKQRLSIARALVKKPEILILDDSASALDYATDAALRKALAALPGDLTVFIVSQRAASLQHADQIIVLDDGRMVGLGRHADLLKTCPVYEEIYASQFKKGDAQK